MSISFSKMSGNGNDFIIIDGRNEDLRSILSVDFVRKVCSRGMSIGGDGLIVIEKSEKTNFKWQFYISDGTMPAMCGNGARCAARFAYINRIAPKEMTFETDAGIIEGYIMDGVDVKVLLTKPHSMKMNLPSMFLNDISYNLHFVDTGVPHAVIFTEELESLDIAAAGAAVRYSEVFAPAGANVNFVTVSDKHNIKVRTYERGVEGETLACGTGVTAAALIAIEAGLAESPVRVLTASGKVLTVHFQNGNAYLQGEARLICTGEMNIEAYNY